MTTDPATALAACLPADPGDDGSIGVPSDAVRGVLAELVQHRRRHPQLVGRDENGAVLPGGTALLAQPAEDGGA